MVPWSRIWGAQVVDEVRAAFDIEAAALLARVEDMTAAIEAAESARAAPTALAAATQRPPTTEALRALLTRARCLHEKQRRQTMASDTRCFYMPSQCGVGGSVTPNSR